MQNDEDSIPSPPPFYRVSGHFTVLNPSRPMALAVLLENARIDNAPRTPVSGNIAPTTGTKAEMPDLAWDKKMQSAATESMENMDGSTILELIQDFPMDDDIFQEEDDDNNYDKMTLNLPTSREPTGLQSSIQPNNETFHAKQKPFMDGSGRLVETPDGLALLLYKTSDRLTSADGPRRHVRWTAEEDSLLRAAVELEDGPPHNWKRIAQKYFQGSRNVSACKGRWNKTFQPGLKLAKWTRQEDDAVLRGQQAGLSWPKIAAALTGRTAEQVRNRFLNEIDPTLNRSPFTDAERERLFELQARYGNKWTKIATEMPGRSEKMVKNCWFNAKVSQERKARRTTVAMKAAATTTESL